MIRHLLKLVWHRKRANALVLAEIFLSFLIVFAVVTMAVSLLSRWRKPLGYSWHNVWVVEINNVLKQEVSSTNTGGVAQAEIDEAAKVARAADDVIRELRSYPEIESAAADSMTPYANNTWRTMLDVNGRHVLVTGDHATDDFARVMRIPIVRGRWFSPDDETQNYAPIVLDADAARAMFGSEDPIGKRFSAEHFFPEGQGPAEFRVIGVIAPYRYDGEFSDNEVRMIFTRVSLTRPTPPSASRLVVRVRPGTAPEFEAQLADRLKRMGAVTFQITRMEAMRNTSMKERLVPVAVLAVVAVFLILMVALGLTGVLWQTVTQRMREMGIRRAMGASGRGVRAHVLGEVAVLSTLSVLLGAIIILQLPLLGVFQLVTPGQFTSGFVAALAVIYTITLLCGAYPSWLASTIEPAEALRYE